MKLADNKATLSFSNGSPSVEMPVYHGSIGPDVIDIRKLYGQTGKFTYDPGFLSTASCNSIIRRSVASCSAWAPDSFRLTPTCSVSIPKTNAIACERPSMSSSA